MRHRMNLVLALAIILLSSLAGHAQAPYGVWAKSFLGNNTNSRALPRATAVDKNGNVYITGSYELSVDFDPGAGTANTGMSLGTFVCKLDANGTYVWSKIIEGSLHTRAIATDGNNVYFAGSFDSIYNAPIDFDPGPGIVYLKPAYTRNEAFICKMSSNGTLVWAKSFLGPGAPSVWGGTDVPSGLAVDASGNVYTCGHFTQTVDFDPSPTATANLTSAGGWDIFVSKLNANGDYVWAKRMGGDTGEIALAMALDAKGNIYTTGFFDSKNADFDPGPGTAVKAATGSDVFVSKLNANGDYVWAKSFSGSMQAEGTSIALCPCGSIYTGGHYRGTVDFDPGSGTANLNTGLFNNRNFASKLDSNGNYVWAKATGGNSSFRYYTPDIALDNTAGNVYITSDFSGTADFDPGSGTANLSATYLHDAFVTKLTSQGAYVWARALPTHSSTHSSTGLVVDANNFIYTIGNFVDTVDFDPGSGTSNLGSNWEGAFITKWAEGTAAYIASNTKVSDVSIAPQPASNKSSIQCRDASLWGKEARIYNIEGVEVAHVLLEWNTVIDVSRWASGLYLVRLQDGAVLKLLKN